MESMMMKPKKLDINYDRKSDVLYISVGIPGAADDSPEPQDGVTLRTRRGELVGITILGLKDRLASSKLERTCRPLFVK
jgi:uncharacterized protein YuzE